MQLHHIPLLHTTAIMRLLGGVGLTTGRPAATRCGRHRLSPGGVCPDEVFDATPTLRFARYFVRRNFTQKMRASEDCVRRLPRGSRVVRITCLGFVGEIREQDGKVARGFRMVVGGGTSIEPVLAPVLYEFVAADDGSYLRVAEAILRVFNRSDELRTDAGRIKILVKRVASKCSGRWWSRSWRAWAQESRSSLAACRRTGEPGLRSCFRSTGRRGTARSRSPIGSATNAIPQKQAGYYAVFVSIPSGDVTPTSAAASPPRRRTHGTGQLRASHDQNLVIRRVRGVSSRMNAPRDGPWTD